MNYHYFVLTPLQYLNALEYRLSVNSIENERHILHIISDHQKRLDILANIIDKNDWDKTRYEFKSNIPRKKIIQYTRELLRRKTNLRRIKHSLNVEDEVIMGSITNTYCKYLHKCCAKSIFLDDGLATLLLESKLKSPFFFPKKINRFLETLIFNQFYFNHSSFTLFSIFKVQHEKITLKKNELNFLKSRYSTSNKKILNEVVFIGQPLVELKIVPQDIFSDYVEHIKAYYNKQGIAFSYFIHPGENIDIKKESWNLISLNEPIEIFYLKNNNIPKVFSSFYSSANINLGMIYSHVTEQVFWKLDSKWLEERHNIDFYTDLKMQEFDFYSIKELPNIIN